MYPGVLGRILVSIPTQGWRYDEESTMPRYLVERSFPDGLRIPVNEDGAHVCRTVVKNNAEDIVTWVHSYVTAPRAKAPGLQGRAAPRHIR